MSTTDHAKPRTDFGAVVRIRYESAGQNPTTPERVADALYRLADPQPDGSQTWTGTAADLSRHLDGVGVESVKGAVREFVREGLLHREGTTLVIPALLPDEPGTVAESGTEKTKPPTRRRTKVENARNPITGHLVWDGAQPLASVQGWQTAVVRSGVGASATRVAIALALVCDSRVGRVYLTDDDARDRFGIARTALHEGRVELKNAGLLRKARKNTYGVTTWDMTVPK